MKVTDIVEIIRNFKEQLNEKSQTDLELIAFQINNSSKDAQEHFIILLQELASYINELDTEDLSSLSIFLEKINLKNEGIIWNYLGQANRERNIERKALLLKISFVLDPNAISIEILNNFLDIKRGYPLFWIDLLFKNNKQGAFLELENYLKNNAVSFSHLYPILSRWVRIAKKEGCDESFKNMIYQIKSYFTKKDSSLFIKWLEENDLHTIVNKIMVNYVKDLQYYVEFNYG